MKKISNLLFIDMSYTFYTIFTFVGASKVRIFLLLFYHKVMEFNLLKFHKLIDSLHFCTFSVECETN